MMQTMIVKLNVEMLLAAVKALFVSLKFVRITIMQGVISLIPTYFKHFHLLDTAPGMVYGSGSDISFAEIHKKDKQSLKINSHPPKV